MLVVADGWALAVDVLEEAFRHSRVLAGDEVDVAQDVLCAVREVIEVAYRCSDEIQASGFYGLCCFSWHFFSVFRRWSYKIFSTIVFRFVMNANYYEKG